MTAKEQVVDRHLAQHLFELGVKQDSLWYWCYDDPEEGTALHGFYGEWHLKCNEYVEITDEQRYSAFTVAELDQYLPNMMHFNEKDRYLTYEKLDNFEGWSVGYFDSEYWACGLNEAEVRAKVLIQLLNDKRIKI